MTAKNVLHVPLPMPEKIYPSFGRCIYCGEDFVSSALTDEHIIPLQLEGRAIIKDACCEPCRAKSNAFEHKAMYSDLLVPRILLRLKRTRRRSSPPVLPPVSIDPPLTPAEFALENKVVLKVEQYPPLISTIILPRAGNIVGIDRGGNLSNFRIHSIDIKEDWHSPGRVIATRHSHDHTSLALTILKIAYCFAVAELGINAFDGQPIRDILAGKRGDVYNFVGMEPNQHYRRRQHLHFLLAKRVNGMRTVSVCLLGGYGLPVYEVALEKSTA